MAHVVCFPVVENTPIYGTGVDGLKFALALLSERKDKCPGAVPVFVCHDEIVVECDGDQAGEVKTWDGEGDG